MGINHAEPDDPPRDSREAASPSDPAGSPTGSAGRADAVRPSTCGAFGTHAAGLITADTYIEEETPLIGRPWLRYPLARADWALAALLLVAALLVRWPFIAKGETLLHSDEAIVGLMAQDIAAGERFPIYFYGQRYMGALEAYVIAAVSPLFDDQIHALRFGPACFLALLTAVQYLMLTRWFGRRGGLIGAMVLLAASPMFTQWSISARGGYIEVLLWGTLLVWAYSEWFVKGVISHQLSVASPCSTGPCSTGPCGTGFQPVQATSPCRPREERMPPIDPSPRRRFLFGALIGSGMWINPAIVLFIVPIVLHALCGRPLAAFSAAPAIGRHWDRATKTLGITALPVAFILAVLAINSIWAVWVEDGRPRSLLLLGLLPKPLAGAVLAAGGATIAFLLARKTRALTAVRQIAARNGSMIIGMLAGAAPAVLYVVQAVLGLRPMDPSLPLGIRPFWLAGETMNYLIHGLPLLFGADPQAFLRLVSMGHDPAVKPLDILTAGCVSGANWLVVGSVLAGGAILLATYSRDLSRMLRLRPTDHPPAMFLLLSFFAGLGLYVLGGCTLDFTTIRYLIPLWAFVPGLVAAVFVSRRFRLAAQLVPLVLCGSWAVGQIAMASQLGNPHPLRRLASTMSRQHVDLAMAELFDAHLLSYLTRQECRTIEFEPFWSRLSHYRTVAGSEGPRDYVVATHEPDRSLEWIKGGYPGRAPPETDRLLWPRLRSATLTDPGSVLERAGLSDGYERIRLREPLQERCSTALVPSGRAP